MKTLMKQRLYASTQLVLALIALAIGASTANGAPGDLFESDTWSGTINKSLPMAHGAPSLPDELVCRSCFDRAGNLYAGEQDTGTIYKFAPDVRGALSLPGSNNPTGLACDSGNNLFAADWLSGTIYKFAPDGARSTFATASSLRFSF
jgi:sugar lactone lactonase YvrE